ncbi:hypothetical protein ACO22_07098 [Paracoccidioides brasiliensis]|uniref:Rhodopsin domain-containing protein n=1 Tax=Paracoccidioides brasiliensis TaxID=121759 RepID=A0A1D2J5R9_PARBR|nr:hypothetical protein ACO22_07098 [Paracoccidioides brasiliensis]
MSIFAVGVFISVTSVLRLTTLNIATENLDITWSSTNSSTWTIIEANVAIICACMPTYKAPLSKVFPGIFNSFYSSKNVAKPKRDSGVDRHLSFYGIIIPKFGGWQLVAKGLKHQKDGICNVALLSEDLGSGQGPPAIIQGNKE